MLSITPQECPKTYQTKIKSSCQIKRHFTFPKSLLRTQETLEKESKRPAAPSPSPSTVLWNQKTLGWYRLAVNCRRIPVSACPCCVYLEVALCSKWQKDEQLPKESSPHVISDLQAMSYKPPLTLPQSCVCIPSAVRDRPNRELVGAGGSNLYSSLLATAWSKGKVVPLHHN